MIERNNFISVQGWMVADLRLSGSELLCYALIYGFSQDGKSVFSGTANYIADWLNINRRQVMRILQHLVDKNLIEKIEKKVNGVTLVDYKASVLKDIGCDKMSYPCDKMSHHNIIDNKDIYNNIYPESPERPTTEKCVDGKTKTAPEKDFNADVLAEMLEIHLEDAYNRKFQNKDWYKQMELLIKRDGVEFERARDVMNWHFENLDRPFCHVILSGKSFREKFSALETQMKKNGGTL